MKPRILLAFINLALLAVVLASRAAQAQVSVPTAPPPKGVDHTFHDARFGVRFSVPPGWTFTRRDREISTFRLDARSAGVKSRMRAVAAIGFNPYPLSTLSGALFYYSVEPHTTGADCEREATGLAATAATPQDDIQDIDGMSFTHGHDEHGQICVEARDEVYTAWRKGSCYRFDLAMNTFCSVSSGAQNLTDAQVHDIEQRMTHILSTVALSWEKSDPHPVPVPAPATVRRLAPQPPAVPAAVESARSL